MYIYILEWKTGSKLRFIGIHYVKFINTLMAKRKLLALFIIIIYLIIFGMNGGEIFFRGILFLLLPVLLIFFSEEMGAFTGFFGGFPRPIVTKTSPAGPVEFMGWVFLLLPFAYGFISAFTNNT